MNEEYFWVKPHWMHWTIARREGDRYFSTYGNWSWEEYEIQLGPKVERPKECR